MLTPSQASSQSQNHNIGVSCDIFHEVQNLQTITAFAFMTKSSQWLIQYTMYVQIQCRNRKMMKNIFEFEGTNIG